MFRPPANQYTVPFDGKFELASAATQRKKGPYEQKAGRKKLKKLVEEIGQQQRMFYATDRWSLLLVFQAMDAAGKDSTIRAVTSGVNPAGFQVYSFKKPSNEELDHDFLWRTARRVPERGRIGIFNRSYYEEVLVVRVHPEYLDYQRLPKLTRPGTLDELWERRFASILEHERHLAASGTVVLKFFLNVSCEEQRRRFLRRIDDPHKNWKFSHADIEERQHWSKYMHAYEQMLRATSRPWAPWFCIPADDKPTMRVLVARAIRDTLDAMSLSYPEVDAKERMRLQEVRTLLENEPPPA